MKLYSVEGNAQSLDGGAMFGNAPRVLWSRWYPPDEQHRIRLACRSLLVREDSGRTVLFEAGIGAFFEPKMRERFGVVEAHHVLLDSMKARGVRPEDIDVVVLSHLHFDHAGGLLTEYREGAAPSLVFPNARYVVGARAWERAVRPHSRDRASFIPELQPMLEATGRLERVEGERSKTLGEGYRFAQSDGHTPGLLLGTVEGAEKGPVTFAADLIPGAAWVHLPITMGYDRYPELLIDEKAAVLDRVLRENGWLFYTHDARTAVSRVARDEKSGRWSAEQSQADLAWEA